MKHVVIAYVLAATACVVGGVFAPPPTIVHAFGVLQIVASVAWVGVSVFAILARNGWRLYRVFARMVRREILDEQVGMHGR